ncbi:hypothetical protein DVH24_010417 [Malus domestica]|uniref:Uncharacterized protein n=1 Tax=Malus domestica TaxID=3750 RepID=A0A498JX77_MALDO|nr:hypothetical protein DVH24_010417 [Malus domestica]
MQGQLEKEAKRLKIVLSKFHNFPWSHSFQFYKSILQKLFSRHNCAANFQEDKSTPNLTCKTEYVFPKPRRIIS